MDDSKLKKWCMPKEQKRGGAAIYGKAFDFSKDTIEGLIKEGEDAGKICYEESQKSEKGSII